MQNGSPGGERSQKGAALLLLDNVNREEAARTMMTRKDSEKDVDRPHYYSQFWLDIAAGRRVIGGPRPEDEAGEAEQPEPAPVPARKNGRNSAADGYKEPRAAVVTPQVVEESEEDVEEPSDEDFPQEEEDMVEEDELPNIVLDEDSPKARASTQDKLSDEAEEAEEAEDEYPKEDNEEGEEEEEEEEEWNGRGGRKKAKPTRPAKPAKRPKTRRGGF